MDRFEERYARFPGLNLTFEVREGIVKHSKDLAPGVAPELDEYLPDLRPPLEAQLIDLADEIAYNTADLDDAHSAGLIRIGQIAAKVPCFARYFEETGMRYPGAADRVQFHETLRALFDWLVSGLITGTQEAAAAAGVSDSAGVRRHRERLARFTPDTSAANRSLKEFLHGHVYRLPLLIDERKRTNGMIAELFQFYLDHPERMPEPYRDGIENQPAHRTVCDYIAGMTDRYFEHTYQQELGRS